MVTVVAMLVSSGGTARTYTVTVVCGAWGKLEQSVRRWQLLCCLVAPGNDAYADLKVLDAGGRVVHHFGVCDPDAWLTIVKQLEVQGELGGTRESMARSDLVASFSMAGRGYDVTLDGIRTDGGWAEFSVLTDEVEPGRLAGGRAWVRDWPAPPGTEKLIQAVSRVVVQAEQNESADGSTAGGTRVRRSR